MWELDYKEGWVLKNWCFQIVVLEKTFESPLDSTEIKPVDPKGNQPWILTGRTNAEAEAPKLWLSDVKSQLMGKDTAAGKDWGQEEKWVTEDKMVGWHHWLNGCEFEQALWVVKNSEAWYPTVHGLQRLGQDWVTEQQGKRCNGCSLFCVYSSKKPPSVEETKLNKNALCAK